MSFLGCGVVAWAAIVDEAPLPLPRPRGARGHDVRPCMQKYTHRTSPAMSQMSRKAGTCDFGL